MPEDTRTDEQLVTDYLGGDKQAMEILLTRYQTIILAFLCGTTWFAKDKSYLDDVRQEVLVTIFNELNQIPSHFTPAGPGSFKKWVYRIAHFEALNHDKKKRKGPKLTSEVFPEEETGIPNDLLYDVTPTSTDYEEIEEQMKEIISKLTKEELKLMKLVCKPMEYKDIQKEPEFQKYSVDYLMLKVYNIRKRMKGE
jgi:DNA-directed RNA polymerase specialized sigma24 family protein